MSTKLDSAELIIDNAKNHQNEYGDAIMSLEEKCLARHRKERKEFQAEIQKLKQSATKGDKKKKKDVAAQIAIMESDMETRHGEELEKIQNDIKAMELTKDTIKIENNENGFSDGQFENGLIINQIESTPKISKSQKRRAKKAQKEMEANERIKSGDNELSNRVIEEAKFRDILSQRNLQMHLVPSDGNCLYASFVHQLSQQNIQTDVPRLRLQASSYMRQHINEFLPFFVHDDTGDLFTTDEFIEYCDKVESTSEWGGQAELRALSDTLEACIEVIQAEVPSHYIGIQFKDKLSITVTYHKHAYGLGEHYNSVCPKGNDSEGGFDIDL